MTDYQRPLSVQVNAWDGGRSPTDALPAKTPWAQFEQGRQPSDWLAPAAPVDQRDWKHPEVGWGLVLRDRADLDKKALAGAADAPRPLQRLVKERGDAPVLRWSPDRPQYLRRYYDDGTAQDLSIAAPRPGTAKGRIPRYLLIADSPADIPWAVQYALNLSSFVGRLYFGGPDAAAALTRYVEALLTDWAGHRCHPGKPLVWTAEHDKTDISWLMARAIGDPVWKAFENDADLAGRRFKGEEATAVNLATALQENKPGLVVTTSHGLTGVAAGESLRDSLGLPVGSDYQHLRLSDVNGWKTNGAIWYAHACCGAGSDGVSRYEGLFGASTSIGGMLREVASNAGASIAPLPVALLGSGSPLRAFVGHVEPTFDWTLRDPSTNQVLTDVLSDALYTQLYQQDRRTPIGYALQRVFREAGEFFGAWQQAVDGVNRGESRLRDAALYNKLVAMDRQTLVILGDPTVALPALHS